MPELEPRRVDGAVGRGAWDGTGGIWGGVERGGEVRLARACGGGFLSLTPRVERWSAAGGWTRRGEGETVCVVCSSPLTWSRSSS